MSFGCRVVRPNLTPISKRNHTKKVRCRKRLGGLFSYYHRDGDGFLLGKRYLIHDRDPVLCMTRNWSGVLATREPRTIGINFNKQNCEGTRCFR